MMRRFPPIQHAVRTAIFLLVCLVSVPAGAQNFTCTIANICTFSGSQSLWPAGSDSAPTIALSTDTDTGIRFPTAGEISFVLNGTETTEFTSTGWRINAVYLNFSTTAGAGGYGFRDNSGTVQFKDSGGAWTDVAAASSGAPASATFITQTANGTLSAEQALSSLSTGLMRVATTTGVITSLTDSAGLFANVSDESGSGALLGGTSPTIASPTVSGTIAGSPTASGVWIFANTGLTVQDTDASHELRLVPGSNLTADRTLTLTTGDAARTVTISGDATLDQGVATTSTPVFETVGVSDSNDSHFLRVETTSDLTADRQLTLVTGDAARTVTMSGDATISQDYSTTGTPSFNAFRPPQGRCTLTSATPVTTADVTAATTLYYALYGGNQITLYDGSTRWVQTSFAQLSITVPATTNTVYDVFVDYTAGTPALEAVAWTNDTTRATALALQNGVYVQTSDTDSLYVCSFRTTGVSGQTEDSFAKRYVWNYYNRVPRLMRVLEATNTWTYTTATYRQANGSTANQLDVVIGVAEVSIDIQLVVTHSSDTLNVGRNVAIGEDSTTTPVSGQLLALLGANLAATTYESHVTSLRLYPAVGRHYYVWLEKSEATGITTWRGDNGTPTDLQSGISGVIEG